MAEINSETSYNEALREVWQLMKKDEKQLTENEVAFIVKNGKAIQDYEKIHYPFPFPKRN